jgi:GNAT superfamily N-acetyltransferase
VIRELAENANTYTSLGPGNERIVDPRFVIALSPGTGPHSSVVQRLRLLEPHIDQSIAEIRNVIATRGRDVCHWEIADSHTPSDLVDRLLAQGCVPDRDEPLAIGMVLTEPPSDGLPGVTARRVETLAEFEQAIRIAHDAFGSPEAIAAESLANAAKAFESEGNGWRTYLAFVDGQPVARATAGFTEHGVLLFGGATREDARGHGAYRALVRARWDDAVTAGTPVLVTHAGAMSLPILQRLGFRAVSRIHILLDEFG